MGTEQEACTEYNNEKNERKIKIYGRPWGVAPIPPPVFEKTGQKLLSKRNYIAFFEKIKLIIPKLP